jgi:dTDP-4-amino-4,6-dideoxygalactose transaminase
MVSSVSSLPKQAQDSKSTAGAQAHQLSFLNLQAQFAAIRDEVMTAIAGVMETQHFILGEEVQMFEQELCSFVGARFAVSCASGSDALLLALLALGVGPGDEVITTPFTFVATAGSIARLGAKPTFVDIDPSTFNIDPEQLASSVNEHTKVLMPVHLFGLAAEMNPILEIARTNGIPVIEDAAQAIGAKYKNHSVGTMGTFGCFSFFPSKNLGGAGDGGVVTTNDATFADRVRLLRVHGSDRKYHYQVLGMNSRLDALQATILRVKLRYLLGWTEGRRQKAARYLALFQEYGLEAIIQLPTIPDDRYHVYNQFVIRCPDRDNLRDYLRHSSIPTEVYYPEPLHLQPAFQYLGHTPGAFPHAEAACREVLALPVYSELEDQHQVAVVEAVANFFKVKK